MKIFGQKSLAIAIVFFTVSGVSAIGKAERVNPDRESVRVSYSDLDITRAEGREALEMRVRGAAQQVCGEVYSKSAREVRENRECRHYAVESALRQVGLQEELAVAVTELRE